jgi:hypothetical protein
MPSAASVVAASSDVCTPFANETIVTSLPSRIVFALPIGTTKSFDITSSATGNELLNGKEKSKQNVNEE